MNRLIIVGNGFDKAHGLETGYNDFLFDYLKKIVSDFVTTGILGKNKVLFKSEPRFKVAMLSKYSHRKISSPEELKTLIKELHDDNYLKMQGFLQRIYQNFSSKKWVDIELDYFDAINAIVKNLKGNNDRIEQNVKGLNEQFGALKEALIGYLEGVNKGFESKEFDLSQMTKSFASEIAQNNFSQNGIIDGREIEDRMFLVFNYIPLIRDYYPPMVKPKNIVHIHGVLDDKLQLPIFGYGNDNGDTYRDLEELRSNEVFRNIKSFGYGKNDNYRKMYLFVESKPFQVSIYGHSCGLTDGTLLKYIFEHENCKSIKINYYVDENGKDNYTEIHYEIARHFSDKNLMRKKVMTFEKCEPMPQPKNTKK